MSAVIHTTFVWPCFKTDNLTAMIKQNYVHQAPIFFCVCKYNSRIMIINLPALVLNFFNDQKCKWPSKLAIYQTNNIRIF